MKIAKQQVWECFHQTPRQGRLHEVNKNRLIISSRREEDALRGVVFFCFHFHQRVYARSLPGKHNCARKKTKTKGKTWPNISTVHTTDIKKQTCVILIKKMSGVSREGKLWWHRHLDWWLRLRIWAAASRPPSWIALTVISVEASQRCFRPWPKKRERARAELNCGLFISDRGRAHNSRKEIEMKIKEYNKKTGNTKFVQKTFSICLSYSARSQKLEWHKQTVCTEKTNKKTNRCTGVQTGIQVVILFMTLL